MNAELEQNDAKKIVEKFFRLCNMNVMVLYILLFRNIKTCLSISYVMLNYVWIVIEWAQTITEGLRTSFLTSKSMERLLGCNVLELNIYGNDRRFHTQLKNRNISAECLFILKSISPAVLGQYPWLFFSGLRRTWKDNSVYSTFSEIKFSKIFVIFKHSFFSSFIHLLLKASPSYLFARIFLSLSFMKTS